MVSSTSLPRAEGAEANLPLKARSLARNAPPSITIGRKNERGMRVAAARDMRSLPLAFVTALVALAGCAPLRPIAVAPTDNSLVPVEILFNHDGCTVYRFKDQGVHHYFARCDGPALEPETITTERCGKKCVEDVMTVTVPRARPEDARVDRR